MSTSASNRQIILDHHPSLDVAGHADDAAELSFLAAIFSSIPLMLETAARFFILPSILAVNCARLILAIVNFKNANNRNFNKFSKLVLEVLKVGAVGTAIIGSLIGVLAIAAITPFLFMGAVGLNTLFHATKCFFHIGKWLTAKGDHGRKHHRNEFLSNLASTITGSILFTGITLLMALKPELGIFKSVVAYGTAVSMGISAVYAGVRAYFSRPKVAETKSVAPQPANDAVAPQPSRAPVVQNNLSPRPVNGVACTHILNQHHDDLIFHVLAQSNPQQKILDLINEKMEDLENPKDRLAFFQDHKRKTKAEFLGHLYTLMKGEGPYDIKSNTPIAASPTELLAVMRDQHKTNDVFASFFKEVGDAQKIFLLVDAYFTKFNPPVKVRGNDGTYGAPYITAADERRQDYTAPNASPAMM